MHLTFWEVLFFLQIHNLVNISSLSTSDPASFLLQLIIKRFPSCALLFFRDRDQSPQILEQLAINTQQQAYYNVLHSYPQPQELSLVSSNLHKYHVDNSLNLTTLLIQPSALPVDFKIRISSYNRRADRCKFVILMLNDIRPEFLTQIFRTITPVYIPITQKDVDHYVFITRPQLVDTLLLTYELPARVKYKIGIGQGDTDFFVRSVCFFCDDGHERIINFPKNFPEEFDYFPDYVRNLKGRTLRVAAPAIRSRVEAPAPWTGINNAKRGMWKTMLEEFLMVKFNFTYNIFVSTGKDGRKGGGGTGLELPNGTWIGTVGDLVAGRADIAIITAQTPKRVKQVAFTNSFFDIGCLLFVTSEGQRIFSPLALLWPFDLLMWFLIFISTLFAFFVFYVIMHSMEYFGMNSADTLSFARRGIVSKDTWGLSHQIFFVMTTYLDQDCVMPRFQPLRCFVALWLFFTLILTTVYRSKMVSLLAFPVLDKLPQTFDALAKSKYEVGFVKHGDSAYNTLAASRDPVYVKLLAEMEIITGNGLECLERAVAKKYGCIAYDFSTAYLRARNLSDNDIRKLVVAPQTTYNIFMGMGLEGGSIYKEGFEKWLGWTRPFHLANLWEQWDYYYNVRLPKRAWWKETGQDEKLKKSEDVGSDDLTLKHISGAFYALGLCLVICCAFFLHEMIYFYRDRVKDLVKVRKKGKLQ